MADFACERPLHKGASAVNRPARRLRRALPLSFCRWAAGVTRKTSAQRPLYKGESPPKCPARRNCPSSAFGLRPFGPETVPRTVSKTGLTPRQALIDASICCSIWTLWKNHRQCRLSGKAPAQAGGCPAELLCRSLCERVGVGALPGTEARTVGKAPPCAPCRHVGSSNKSSCGRGGCNPRCPHAFCASIRPRGVR